MILYRLRCSKGQEFESWFKDSKTYERQEKKSLIGCAVCGEKFSSAPCYIFDHPNCTRNDTCAGQYFTCNAACPTIHQARIHREN